MYKLLPAHGFIFFGSVIFVAIVFTIYSIKYIIIEELKDEYCADKVKEIFNNAYQIFTFALVISAVLSAIAGFIFKSIFEVPMP